MSTTLSEKYQTLKMSKSIKRATTDGIFARKQDQKQPHHLHTSASSPDLIDAHSTDSHQPKPSYSLFIAELISAFNSLSSTSSTTTAPTSSSILHTFFQGADHEAHVDGKQKKNVVKALQNADPAKVNEIISLLKAMPDPTATGARSPWIDPGKVTAPATTQKQKKSRTEDDKENNNNGNLKNGNKTTKGTEKWGLKKQKQERLDNDLEEWDEIEKGGFWSTPKSNDQATGVVIESDSSKGPRWFPSSAPSTPIPTASPPTANEKATYFIEAKPEVKQDIKQETKQATSNNSFTSSGFGSLRLNAKTKSTGDSAGTLVKQQASKKSFWSGEQIALAAASLLVVAAASTPKELKTDPAAVKASTLHRQASMPLLRKASMKALLPTTKPDLEKATPPLPVTEVAVTSSSYLIATINSITKQFFALQQGPPSLHNVSVYTFWWGYEIYVPHKCIENIERVSNTSQIFFNILSSAISGIPGLGALVPIAKIISAWVGYQWSVIKAEDVGRGVVISATWVLPVALASRSWDHPGGEEDVPMPSSIASQPKKTLKSKLKLIGN
ncbi:hypothetical protein BGZ99_002113 [Dissophora globulifera]|uniref:Uncharacterized protein n=1 Tax=Dissophora globulifera TaxID=979702 RepID=A0A9P6V090_9FUNG|nr:hypothetical protein BGZ99_002113 [Dissophora globulifera]